MLYANFLEGNMCSSCIALNRLPVGQKAVVTSILLEGNARKRLMDLGLIEGTEVKSLYKSPAANPIAYMFRGAVIALRTDVSEKILVTY